MNDTTNRNQVFFAGSGTLNIGGTMSGGGLTPSTGTVNYNNGGAQTVGTYTYNNLTLSGSGTKTFGATTTVNGNLSIASGVVTNLGTFTHSANRLFLGGGIASIGSWGSTTSIATNKNDTYFAATSGLVNVNNSTCTAYQASINSSDSACNTVTPGSVNLKVKLTGGTGPFTVVYRNEITNAITTVTNYVSDSNIVISPLPTQTTPYTLVSVTDAGGCLATLVNAYTSVLFYGIPATPTATTVGVTCPNDATGSITITNTFSPASLKFNGVNTSSGSTTPIDSHVDFGTALLSNRPQFTAEGWIKINKNDLTGKDRMSLFGQNDVLEFGFEGGNLRCWTSGGGTVDMSLTSYPSDNAWHHIAVIGNGTNLRFFIDGVLVATGGGTTTNYGSSTFTTKIGWGVMDAGGVGLVGEVFNLGFWSRALSVEELQGLASGFTRYNSKQVGLLAGYSFDEGSGTSVASVGSPAPVGTLKGATLPVWTDPSVYSWTSAVPGFVTTSNKNLTGLKAGTYNLNISLKGCPKTTSFTVDSTNPGVTPPIIGTITQPTCALATGSVALSGLPSSGSWSITATPATSGLTGLGGTGGRTVVGGLTANTSYTFVVSNGLCSSIASAAVVVNAIPTTATWNGTAWVGTASGTTPPLITQPIVFSGNYTSTNDINGCSCSVTSGNVVINSGHTMTITNAINVTNNASTSLVFNDKSSLVQTTNATNTGAIEYRRISSPMKNFDFTYWSSPVTGQTAKLLSPNTLADKYFKFSGSANDWVFDDGEMKPGVGFIIRTP
ncbi:LamG-like jellyroll fold domain-containing protein, partial [Flavobacterium sp.]|uniref:LamG-like jellyroll fold domain-containing protein n=1 Tax=Flavobacterium sp. TaxID=239 RepID=UPI00345DBB24